MSSGPQLQREKAWSSKTGELSQVERQDLVRQDLVMEQGIEKEIYEAELSRLRRESSYLKESLARSLKELKAYQLKYPSAYNPHQPISGDELPPWISSAEATLPLFDAYDSKITELEEIVKQFTLQLESLKEQAEVLVTENENLRNAQLETLRQTAIKARKDDGSGPSFGPMEAELMNELNERVEILLAENALMVEQKTVLINELDGYQSELQKSNIELSELNQQVSILTTDLKNTRIHLNQCEKDRENATKQVVKYSEALGRMEAELEDCKIQLEEWQQKGDAADNNMGEAKKQLRALTVRMEEDSFVYTKRVKAAEDRVRELQLALSQKTQELDASAEVNRKLRREYQSTRQDAEGMLQVMTGLERQLSEFAAREDDVQRVAKASKEQLEEALVQRDQAVAREEQYRREMENLLEEKKRAAVNRQKDLEEAAEQTKAMMAVQMKMLEAGLTESETRNSSLRVEAEKAIRDCRILKEQFDRLHRELESQRDAAGSAMKELEEKLVVISIGREEDASRLNKTRETNMELRSTIDKLRTQLETVRSSYDEKARAKDKEIDSLRLALKDSHREFEEQMRNSTRVLNDLRVERDSASEGAVEAERRRDEERIGQRRRILELEALLEEMKLAGEKEEQRMKSTIYNLNESLAAIHNQNEARLLEEREAFLAANRKCKQLEENIQSFAEEKKSLDRVISKERRRVAVLKDELMKERRRLKDLAARLATSFEAREAYVRATARSYGSMDVTSSPRNDGGYSIDVHQRGTSPDSVRSRGSEDSLKSNPSKAFSPPQEITKRRTSTVDMSPPREHPDDYSEEDEKHDSDSERDTQGEVDERDFGSVDDDDF